MKALILSVLCLVVSYSGYGQQNKSYTFVFLNTNPDAEKISKEESTRIFEGHMANINALAKAGKLVAAGPFEGGGGLFILNTTSLDTAQAWLSTDPGVRAKRWNIEMFPYTPRSGPVCKAPEPYEMVMYSFVRFDAVVSKFNAGTYPQIVEKHNEYLRKLSNTGNVVHEGIFGEYDGGILIMKGEVEREIFEADPGVQEGLMDLDIKKLYIAKGSFCEK